MGRRGSYGGFRSTPSLGKKAPHKPDEDKKSHSPAKVETTHGESMISYIAEGLGWGTGTAMGDRIMDAVFGPRTIRQEIVLPEKAELAAVRAKDNNDKFKDHSETCSISYNKFQDCLNVKGNNISKCHIFMDSLFECRRNSSSSKF